ncbi:MAG: DUF1800 domain-containing protein [Pseudomonadota bacterium]
MVRAALAAILILGTGGIVGKAAATLVFEDGFEGGPVQTVNDVVTSEADASRFLSYATFGPTMDEITALNGSSSSAWFLQQQGLTPSSYLDYVFAALQEPGATDGSGQPTFQGRRTPNHAFWELTITGPDQLRQRMAFALSQILVVSNAMNTQLFDWPTAVGYYQDVLMTHALGNYRDLLEAVTYAPAMGSYLTYLQNTKGDEASGRVPDENYAREIMQLFTIGLVALNPDGSPILQNGQPVELYDNSDVTGLARVFTGLSLDSNVFFFGFNELNSGALFRPMKIFPDFHSPLEKSFLGTTIPAGTGAAQSIDTALDLLVDHPNTPPFLARQLIQRFVASNPPPAYVARVAQAFSSGRFVLPNGSETGDGRRGDLAATLAAVLFDPEARNVPETPDQAGKLREPVLRFTQWARAFRVAGVEPTAIPVLDFTGATEDLAQAPFQSPSVFNFYRPAFVAPGTLSGAEGLTMPELQIVNANSVFGYSNFMGYFISGQAARDSASGGAAAFEPNYSVEQALAGDPATLLNRLDLLLNHGATSAVTRQRIIAFVESLPLTQPSDPGYDGPLERVAAAIQMLMTSPDYLVLKAEENTDAP